MRKSVTFRCPPEILRVIDSVASTRKRSQMIVDLLERGLKTTRKNKSATPNLAGSGSTFGTN